MASPPLWMGLVFGGLFLLVGLGLLASSVRRVRKAATLARSRVSPVAALSAGDIVTVTGTIEPLTDERAPAHFRGDEGVAVTTRVLEKRGAGGGGPPAAAGGGEMWTTKRVYFDHVPFAVADGTGQVAVDPPSLDAYPTEASFRDSIRLETQTVNDAAHVVGTAPGEFDEYAFDGEPVADVAADRRFEQGVLAAGDEVSVTGRVVRTDDGRLAVGHGDNPDAFTLTTEGQRDASVLGQSVGAVLLGVLGGVCTVIGGGALAVTVLPTVL